MTRAIISARNLETIHRLLDSPQERTNPISISERFGDILPPRRQLRLHLFVILLLCSVLSDDQIGTQFDIHPRVSNPDNHTIQPQEEPAQQQQPLRHDAYLARQDRNTIIREFVFVQYNVVVEKNRIRPREQIGSNGSLVRVARSPPRSLLTSTRRALVVCTIGPVERLDDLFDAFLVLAVGLPLLGIRHLQHAIRGLGHSVQGVKGVEVELEAGWVFDAHAVVAEDHLRHWYA